MPHQSAVANLNRMQQLARLHLFDPALATELEAICRRTAERLAMPYVGVHAVLDTATAVLATNGGGSGLPAGLGGLPNEMMVCPVVVERREPLIVDDFAADEHHRDNPGVQLGRVRAYAGVPIMLADGEIIGTHCVSSPEPRRFSDADIAELNAAATEIVEILLRSR